MKHTSRVSPRCCGKDVVAVPENSDTAGDLNVEMGLMCTDEKDIDELNEM